MVYSKNCFGYFYRNARCFHSLKTPRTVSIISVPINLGQPRLGPDLTPAALFDHGLIDVITSCDWRVEQVNSSYSFRSDDPYIDTSNINAKNIIEVGQVCELLKHEVTREILKDRFILILGGDHCLPIGSIPAIMEARPNTGIIWVDAHADLNTPTASISGNMHGMPLGFLTGLVENAKSLPSFNWFSPCLTARDIVYIGLRDVDDYEKRMIQQLNIKAYTMHEVDKYGIGHIMTETINYLEDRNLHLSFDIDAVDPFFAPHTGTAVRGGLTFREANYICEALAETGCLTSMELVEVNPMIHTHQSESLTLDMAVKLIGSAMGQRIL